jgi:hypothetical protein
MQTYRTNRGSRRYYEDLDSINNGEKLKPKTNNEPKPMSTITFAQVGTWAAKDAAEDWLHARGFSIGPSQVCAPRAIWHGDYSISKWRNLSPQEKRDVHAIMEGDIREGPVTIKLMPGATDEARAAFALTDAEAASKGENSGSGGADAP